MSEANDDFLREQEAVGGVPSLPQDRRGRESSVALAGLMLTDKAPEWKYPACPFSRISARHLREEYGSLVGWEYEWKCQSYESVSTFLFRILL